MGIEHFDDVTSISFKINNKVSITSLKKKLTAYLNYHPMGIKLYRSSGHYILVNKIPFACNHIKDSKHFHQSLVKLLAKRLNLKITPLKNDPGSLKAIYLYKDVPIINSTIEAIRNHAQAKPNDERSQWTYLLIEFPSFISCHLKLPSYRNVKDLYAINQVLRSHDWQVTLTSKNEHTPSLVKQRKYCRQSWPYVRQLITDSYAKTETEQRNVLKASRCYRPSSEDIMPDNYRYPYHQKGHGFDPHIEAEKIVKLLPLYVDEDGALMVYILNGPLRGEFTTNPLLINTSINLVDPGLTGSQMKDLIRSIKSILLAELSKPKKILSDRPELIAFANGIFNRKTGKLMPFSPNLPIEAKLAVKYNPKWQPWYKLDLPFKHCTWLPDGMRNWNPRMFLFNLANHNHTRIKTIMQMILECLSTQYSHHRAIILFGPADTGKSTLLIVLQGLVGDKNCSSLQLERFDTPFASAALINRVADLSHEGQATGLLKHTSKLKAIITGDSVEISAKYQQAYSHTFHNIFICQATNKLPRLPDDNGAAARRLLLLKFNNRHIRKHGNSDIRNDYIKRPEFLEWLAYTILREVPPFKKYTVSHKDHELNIAQQYRDDPLKRFIKSEIMPVFNEYHDNLSCITKGYVYLWYRAWACHSGLKSLSKIRFLNKFTTDLKDMFQIPPLIDPGKRITLKRPDTEELKELSDDDPSNNMPVNQPDPNDGYKQRGIFYYNITDYAGKSARTFIVNPSYQWPKASHSDDSSAKFSNDPQLPF